MARMKRSKLYAMSPLDIKQNCRETDYDFLMVACGSDYRAYEVLRKCPDNNINVKNVLAFNFEERHDGLDQEGTTAYDSHETMGFNVKPIPCSILDPPLCLKSLGKSGVDIGENSKVAIDISCFTKPYFFSILKYLKEQATVNSVTIFYTEPLSYVFSKGLYQSYHSTYGPLSVMEIPGFPGNDTRTTKKILVVLLGFDGELSLHISEEVAPDEIVVVNGFPAYSPKFKDISLINNEKLMSSSGSSRSIQYARANNPFATFNLLEQLKYREPSAFFNVAPIGTKPMALGACLFALVYSDVRIVYPFPERYAHVTTKECWYGVGCQ